MLLRSSDLIVWYCRHCKRKCNRVAVAEPQSCKQLVPSAKPCRTVCSFRWLKLSLNLERSFTSYTSWAEKMDFDFILINGDILLWNSLYESIFCNSGSRPSHILMQQGKMMTEKLCFCRLVLQDVFDLMI